MPSTQPRSTVTFLHSTQSQADAAANESDVAQEGSQWRMESTRMGAPEALLPEDASATSSEAEEDGCGAWEGERVLHQTWVLKRSQWLGMWRPRYLLLTPSRLLSFREEPRPAAGRRSDGSPTDEFAVSSIQSVNVLTEAEMLSASAEATPLSCFALASGAPAHGAIVRVRQRAGAPSVLLAPAVQARASLGDARSAASSAELATAIVNAVCAKRTGMTVYLRPKTVHAFERSSLLMLDDRYAVSGVLGKGTFGTVVRGRCLQSGRAVAIKRVSMVQHRSSTGRICCSMLMRALVSEEVSILRQLRGSPYVVQLLNYVETPSEGCLIMELLPGGDLYTQMVSRYCNHEGYSEADVRQIGQMALTGLAAIHDLDVVHRDLKPENVLLIDRRGGLPELRIADFGAARRLRDPGSTGGSNAATGRAGTPGYMAPEVIGLKPYGLPADIWSLGVILFVLLCGSPPSSAVEQLEQLAGEGGESCPRRSSGDCSFADPTWDDVSVEAKELLRNMLAGTPHRRPSAQEALDSSWLRPFDKSAHETNVSGVADARLDRWGGRPLTGSKSLLSLAACDEKGWAARTAPKAASFTNKWRRGTGACETEGGAPAAGGGGGAQARTRSACSSEFRSAARAGSDGVVEETPSTMLALIDQRAGGALPGAGRASSSPCPPCTSSAHPEEKAAELAPSDTDLKAQRVRVLTASRNLRAVRAGLGSFAYEGATIEATDPEEARWAQLPGRLRHGHGKIRYDCGSSYVGEWAHDRRSGQGRMVYANGDVYEGGWRDGMYDGHGEYTSPGGLNDEYAGQWKADKPHGVGRHVAARTGQAQAYEGGFANGLRDGWGREIRAVEGCYEAVEGCYECGERISVALTNANFALGVDDRGLRIRMFTAGLTCQRAMIANLASCTYEGETIPAEEAPAAPHSRFSQLVMPGRLRHGHGKIRYQCGNEYDGQWSHDRRSGRGTYRYACGDVYEGDWKDGMYHGRGAYEGSDSGGGGDHYVGEWQADQPHGHGRYTYRASGECYEGQWAEGRFHGRGTYYAADGSVKSDGLWSDGLSVPTWQQPTMLAAEDGCVGTGVGRA